MGPGRDSNRRFRTILITRQLQRSRRGRLLATRAMLGKMMRLCTRVTRAGGAGIAISSTPSLERAAALVEPQGDDRIHAPSA